jgi:ATPase subunit of ABC transporter with duplicated ATPase domains
LSTAGTLAAANITKSHGAQIVLHDVTLVVPPRARIGLVGANGVGKSTLLRILAGLEEPDAGRVRRSPPELAVGYLPQERELRRGETIAAFLARRTGVAAANATLDALTERLTADAAAIEPHARALDRFLALGGADLEARASAVCAELGLDVSLHADTTTLSGGEAARTQLAAILLARFDVFLLDEPTNDLDFDGLARLERFVADVDGAIVVVSHDRRFLDRTVARIVELDEWTRDTREYSGGWSEYERARELARQQQYAAYGEYVGEKQRLEQQLHRMQEWERRGYGQGRKKKKTKDVQSAIGGRVKRLDAVEKPYEPWQLQLSFGGGPRSGDVVIRLDGVVLQRGDFQLGPLDLALAWGERLAVTGPNGSGKTTLLAALLGRLVPARGRRWIGPGVVVGELEQRRGEFAAGNLLDAFVVASAVSPEDARTLLAKFGLGADDVLRPSASLSPGERTRAVLALLAARGVNCLVLDEPTNHLDVAAIEELERALDAYRGTIVLVTHDRRFLETFRATRVVAIGENLSTGRFRRMRGRATHPEDGVASDA